MAARRKKKGKKHRLLLYRHMINRIWRVAFLLDIVLWLAWGLWKVLNFLNWEEFMRALQPPRDRYLLIAAIAALVFVLFLLILRNRAFVQVHPGYILLAAPLFRLRIGFRRLRAIRSVDFGQLFDYRRLSWADKNFVRPYLGRTVLVINTRGLPISRQLIRLFLPKYVLNPKGVGFAFLVSDWMRLSAEIESARKLWRERHIERPKSTLRGMYDG